MLILVGVSIAHSNEVKNVKLILFIHFSYYDFSHYRTCGYCQNNYDTAERIK